jgi:hypothetical protein
VSKVRKEILGGTEGRSPRDTKETLEFGVPPSTFIRISILGGNHEALLYVLST